LSRGGVRPLFKKDVRVGGFLDLPWQRLWVVPLVSLIVVGFAMRGFVHAMRTAVFCCSDGSHNWALLTANGLQEMSLALPTFGVAWPLIGLAILCAFACLPFGNIRSKMLVLTVLIVTVIGDLFFTYTWSEAVKAVRIEAQQISGNPAETMHAIAGLYGFGRNDEIGPRGCIEIK
jgi:hypothetical protein